MADPQSGDEFVFVSNESGSESETSYENVSSFSLCTDTQSPALPTKTRRFECFNCDTEWTDAATESKCPSCHVIGWCEDTPDPSLVESKKASIDQTTECLKSDSFVIEDVKSPPDDVEIKVEPDEAKIEPISQPQNKQPPSEDIVEQATESTPPTSTNEPIKQPIGSSVTFECIPCGHKWDVLASAEQKRAKCMLCLKRRKVMLPSKDEPLENDFAAMTLKKKKKRTRRGRGGKKTKAATMPPVIYEDSAPVAKPSKYECIPCDIEWDDKISSCPLCLKNGLKSRKRQFACKPCDAVWWRPAKEYTSICKSCKHSYLPVPFEKEFGLGTVNCPCGNIFTGYIQMGKEMRCYKCMVMRRPVAIVPHDMNGGLFNFRRWRNSKKRKSNNLHSCKACEGRNRRECPYYHKVVQPSQLAH
jgi:hypothetical protein